MKLCKQVRRYAVPVANMLRKQPTNKQTSKPADLFPHRLTLHLNGKTATRCCVIPRVIIRLHQSREMRRGTITWDCAGLRSLCRTTSTTQDLSVSMSLKGMSQVFRNRNSGARKGKAPAHVRNGRRQLNRYDNIIVHTSASHVRACGQALGRTLAKRHSI